MTRVNIIKVRHPKNVNGMSSDENSILVFYKCVKALLNEVSILLPVLSHLINLFGRVYKFISKEFDMFYISLNLVIKAIVVRKLIFIQRTLNIIAGPVSGVGAHLSRRPTHFCPEDFEFYNVFFQLDKELADLHLNLFCLLLAINTRSGEATHTKQT